MKSGWQLKPLSDLCGFQRGLTYAKSDEVSESRNVVLRANNVDLESNNLLLEDLRYIADSVVIPSDKRVKKGSMLICTASGSKSHLGKVAYVDRDMDYAFGGFMGQITPNDEIDGRYLFYALTAPAYKEFIAALSDGANINNLKFNDLGNYLVGVPDLDEQQRIVAILDEAFAEIATAKANAEKNLQNALALFESYLNKVFAERLESGIDRSLGDVCSINSMLVDPRRPEFLDLTHVGAGNIETKTGAFVDLKSARDEGLISGKFLFDESMVLYSKIRPYLMKVARPDFNGLCSADMYPLSPNSCAITRDYLFYLLLSKRFTDYAIQGSARAGMPKVNRDHLFAYRFCLPDEVTQRSMATKLDELHLETKRLESIFQQKLASLDELKKSLLHQAFSGAL